MRYRDWFAQAERDLAAARDSEATGHYEWCCFQAQQAAEKALKAILLKHNIDLRLHPLLRLLDNIEQYIEQVPSDIWDKCRELDRHYIQPRYPNGFIEGFPTQYYDNSIAKRCIEYAECIIEYFGKKIE